MSPDVLLALLIGGAVVGICVVGLLVYKGKISWSKAAMIFAGLGAGLAALWAGWNAGRHQKPDTSSGQLPDLPPEPTTPSVAKTEVVKNTEEEIGKIEDAEEAPAEIRRLKRLAEGASQ